MAAPGELRWFRFYTDAIDNSKLKLIAFEDRWHYVAVCCLKRKGLLDQTDDPNLTRRIAISLGVQVMELDEIKRRLIEVNLIDENFQPVGWDERQFESDSSKERMRQYRERKKQHDQGSNGKQRNCDVTVTPQETETEQKQNQKREQKVRASRFAPKDFHPTDDMKEFARDLFLTDCEIEKETAKFKDYEYRKPLTDFNRAWRNWIRKSIQFRVDREGPNPNAGRAQEFPCD